MEMGSIRRVAESIKERRDYERAAKVARLFYVNSSTKGIRRERKGNGFVFTYDGNKITDASTLERIKRLAIPPAWTDVWISSRANGHIQATGFDARRRKQYKYHYDWNTLRNETKFQHLYEFGKALPRLRRRLRKDLAALFQFINKDGVRSSIDSGMVNRYIQDTTGKNFSAKDFRTWAGTLAFLSCLKSLEQKSAEAESKKNILSALDEVSKKLGNTRAICRKYYVHPKIIALYEENKLSKYLDELDDNEVNQDTADLSHDEKILMRILEVL